MVVELRRKDNVTNGELWIDGQLFCKTIEEKDRGLTSEDRLIGLKMSKTKLHELINSGENWRHDTAMPTGTYRLHMTRHKKLRRWLPYVEGVRYFPGRLYILPPMSTVTGRGDIIISEENERRMAENFYKVLRIKVKREMIWLRITNESS